MNASLHEIITGGEKRFHHSTTPEISEVKKLWCTKLFTNIYYQYHIKKNIFGYFWKEIG